MCPIRAQGSEEGEKSATAKAFPAGLHDFLTVPGARAPGMEGNLTIDKRVAERFAASGFKHGAISFSAPAFTPGQTSIVLPDGRSFNLHPMHPTLFRPGNFEEDEFTANLVYLGRGTYADLEKADGRVLKDSIALMEFDCGRSWIRMLRFGIRGFIFIGADRYTHREAVAKVHPTEVCVPRFFVSKAEGEALREHSMRGQDKSSARIHAKPSKWARVQLHDRWVLIPGSNGSLSQEAVVFVAPMDANSVVPELAQGAQSGTNLYLLMKLLDTFKEHPPTRSVVLAAVNARTQGYLGDRMLAWHLLAPREDIENVRQLLSDSARQEEMYAKAYRKIHLTPETLGADKDYLNRLRTLVDQSTGRRVIVKKPLQDYAKGKNSEIKTDILNASQADMTEEERRKTLNLLNEEKLRRTRVLSLFNKFEPGAEQMELDRLKPEEVKLLRDYVGELTERYASWAALNRKEIAEDEGNGAIRDALDGRQVALVCTLDLTFRTSKIGFSSFNPLASNGRWVRGFGLNTVRIAAETEGLKGFHPDRFLDTMTGNQGTPEGYYFPAPSSSVGHFMAASDTPAVSLQNAFSDEGLAFTPADTLAQLDPVQVKWVFDMLPDFFRAILDHASVTESDQLPKPNVKAKTWSVQLKSFKMDEFSPEAIPQVPVPGSVVMIYPRSRDSQAGGESYRDAGYPPIVGGDVINLYFALTDLHATTVVYGLKEVTDANNPLMTATFRFDGNFHTPDHALDLGGIQEMQLKSNIVQSSSTTLPMFRCREFPVWTREDASLLGTRSVTTSSLWPITGPFGSEPHRYGVTGVCSLSSARPANVTPEMIGPAAVYLEEKGIPKGHDTLRIITGEKRVALRSTKDDPEGLGFKDSEELGPDLFATAAKDMALLNRHRLSKMRGVAQDLVEDYLQKGERAQAGVQQSAQCNDHNGYLCSVYLAVGAQAKAYAQLAHLQDDMLHGIVFYMALLLPFCFFLQKLLFRFKKFEHELGSLAVFFVLTYLIFRNIHPAFRVARTPEAIFVAFALFAIGSFVIFMLHRRFQGEMDLIFRPYLGSSGTATQSMVGQQALMVGVSNMKRRRVRTTLTTATIVLVTFTMLAFSSVSVKVSPTIIHRSDEAPYTGLFFQQPGNKPLREETAQIFRDFFSNRGQVLSRRWILPGVADESRFTHLHLAADNGKSLRMRAALGLSKQEDGFLAPMPIHMGGRFFSSDDALEAILPARAAEALELSAKDVGRAKLSFRGHDLKLVGIMDDERFAYIRDLHARSLLPVEKEPKPNASNSTEVTTDDDTGVEYVDSSALLILPEGLAEDFGAPTMSVSVRLNKDIPLWDVVDEVILATEAKFHIGSTADIAARGDGRRRVSAGTYYVGSGHKTSIGGLARLLVPLLIVGTIILNTMLGSVYERRGEISIYNAIGLNPTHIALFFLGEAFVYGMLGSVGGYLIGQVLAIGLQSSGLVSEINVNFSSMMVAYVIAFVVLMVMLSTLYPAWVAIRTAVPSGQHRWSLPEHDGNTMRVRFPFIYQTEVVPGVMAYLAAFFDRFSEASVGDLIAEASGRGKGQDAEGRITYHISYDVALAPFDLGVTQKVKFEAAYLEVAGNYAITMNIERISGQDSNWSTTNKPFLEHVRRYLLQWRNMPAASQPIYEQQGKKIF